MLFGNIKIKDVKIELGALVKTLRKRDKLSQQELGDLLDLSRITIQNLEGGKNFTIDTLLKVVQHFDLLTNVHQEISNYRTTQEDIEPLY